MATVKNIIYKDTEKIIEVSGDIDISNYKELKLVLPGSFDEEKTGSLIVNMKETSYLDSPGIGSLAAARKTANSKQKNFGLANVNSRISEIFVSASLLVFFSITNI